MHASEMKRQPVCPRCGSVKALLRTGILRCKTCTNEWNRQYYHRSADRRHKQRGNAVLRKYGVPMEYLLELLAKQNECCAICKLHWRDCVPSKHSKYDMVFLQYLYVDHCHTTGRVRGLLCNKCNIAIAMLDENLERFDAAKRYLNAGADSIER